MAIKIIVSDQVGFKVQGSINDAAGTPQPFDFRLVCTRLDADQIKDLVKPGNNDSLVEFLAGKKDAEGNQVSEGIVKSWSGVQDGAGGALAYSADNLLALLKISGMAGLVFRTYMVEVGAKEKN